MYFINKITKKISFYESEKAATVNKISDLARLTNEQKLEIESLFFDAGTVLNESGEEVPNMIDLNLIESMLFKSVEGELFDNVTDIVYKDRNIEIEKYNNNKINLSFYGKKMKIHIPSLDIMLENSFSSIYASLRENDNIVREKLPQYLDSEGVTIKPFNLYLNKINPLHVDKFEAAVAAGIVDAAIFNPTQVLEVTI